MRDLSAASDAALVIAVGRGRQAALAELYRRHGGAVHALACRLLRQELLADEVTQEVFVRLWDAPDRYDPARGSLRAFLLAQAHSRSVDVIRSEASRRTREERDARLRVAGGYDLEREVWDLAVAEQVRDALGSLPEREREAIELAYFGGHSYREVARLLDESEGTIKSRIRTGLRRLRGNLAESGVSAP